MGPKVRKRTSPSAVPLAILVAAMGMGCETGAGGTGGPGGAGGSFSISKALSESGDLAAARGEVTAINQAINQDPSHAMANEDLNQAKAAGAVADAQDEEALEELAQGP